jgi:hypothetical protein
MREAKQKFFGLRANKSHSYQILGGTFDSKNPAKKPQNMLTVLILQRP